MANKKLYRNQNNAILGGVASGMADYFNADPTLIRVLWVIFGLFSFGTAIILYLAMWIIVPETPRIAPKKIAKKVAKSIKKKTIKKKTKKR